MTDKQPSGQLRCYPWVGRGSSRAGGYTARKGCEEEATPVRSSARSPAPGPSPISEDGEEVLLLFRIPREGSVFEVIVVGFPQDITEDELTRIGEQYQSKQ